MSCHHRVPQRQARLQNFLLHLREATEVPRWANFRKELRHCALALALIDPKLEYGTKPFLHERIGQKVEKLRQSRFLSHSGMALVK